MALPSFTFLAGIALLAYLVSFVFFALIRVITGVSIQRIGYSGLRRIAFTPKEGLKIEIRGLGLTLHRPTFAQPTWLSVVLTELKVTVDLKKLNEKPRKKGPWPHWANGSPPKEKSDRLTPETVPEEAVVEDDGQRSKTWEKLTKIKDHIKRLHRKIQYIRMVDVVATSSAIVVEDVGTIQVGSFTMAVDTRRKMVDRSRLFQHRRAKFDQQRPAEWIFTIRSVLFTPEGKDATEILDHCTLNINGLLYKDLDGLRDASIALKLGRLNVPYDDFQVSLDRAKSSGRRHVRHDTVGSETDVTLQEVIEELNQPGSQEENIVQAVSDSKEFVSSILRGIQEIQFAVSFFGLTKRIESLHPEAPPVYVNASMKEVGLDLLRLDQRSPAHLMYFSKEDVAHQALIAAISISIGIDDGHGQAERLLYIPMATNTLRTTFPSKTIQFSRQKNATERNSNIFISNLIVTSPSVDLDPKHLPLLLALLQGVDKSSSSPHPPHQKRNLISRLLPKASVKISVHEPVVRVTLPPMEKTDDPDDFDLLISSSSSISLDVDASHSSEGELHYFLSSTLRVASHHLYYQTASGEKHNLLLTENMELKIQLNANPDVVVVANGNFQTFSVYLVRPEICEGLRQIVHQLRNGSGWTRKRKNRAAQRSFLRRVPPWLLHAQLQGSDFSFEVAGIDPSVSRETRGLAFHLESWNAEYKANKSDDMDTRVARRRATSRTIQREDYIFRPATPTSPRRRPISATDGRRLAIHIQNLEGFVVEAADVYEPESFLALPRFEVAFTTSTDAQGPIFHVNSFAKSLFLKYSLYRHFAIGVATMVLRKTFIRQGDIPTTPNVATTAARHLSVDDARLEAGSKAEITTIDFKAGFLQVKATMPSDPPLMLQMHGLEAGRHRWANPFARARLVRLYADTPNIPGVWSRVISVKGLRLDYRKNRRKSGSNVTLEQSIDVDTDAIRIAVPHQLVLHKIFDNIANVTKTIQQLHHRFTTNTDEYILDKPPEGPKKVPRVALRAQALCFEIEDGAFEWKLGVIYRLGLLEQKQRLAREDAFKLKVKKLEELERSRKGTSRFRARSAHPRGRSRFRKVSDEQRSKSADESDSDRTRRNDVRESRKMRYDTEGTCGLSNVSTTNTDEAWDKLQRLNAQTWKRRIDHGLKNQNAAMRDIRSIFWGLDELPEDIEQTERILAIPQRPALMAALISDLNIVIDKPSFPLADYPHFLNRVGKGMPYDMQYSLLIPMNVQISMGEARVTLRDYPLPLLHVPAIRPGQSPRLPSLSLRTDFVIAEEFRDPESSRDVRVVVVPPEEEAGGLAVTVRRTVAAVKTYSDMNVEVNTSYPTKITWGTSYQPAIQDMMQVIENFTKPAVDPSERVGFWDKIRLTFHSRVNVAWKGDGDVHLILKGSRDPYMVTSQGAGFVMCWRNDVRLGICQRGDPKKFMTVDSGTYVLAIPDLGHYARQAAEQDMPDSESLSSASTGSSSAIFQKTIMKLSGNVQWLAGLVFERNMDDGGRSFDFKPHYDVVLKNPKYAKSVDGKDYDAFHGFRSHHIHMSVAVAAPVNGDAKHTSTYNSVHLTPRFFSHFFSWWSMFSGVMSLPIRQGKLWPGVEKSSKKFGRHLATIKYNLLFSPLYMSHIYKHKDAEEFGQGSVSATGLKIRLDSFMLDLHQRREEFQTQVQGPPGRNSKQNQTTGMRINEAQLDFISADIRAVSASIAGTNVSDLDTATDDVLASYQTNEPSIDLTKFEIPDNDLSWVDMDDFVELGWILPSESNPETKILPLAFTPRFTYFRQTDHRGNIAGDPNRSSPFGNEPTHFCVMTAKNDPRRVQCDLIEKRIRRVQDQLDQNQRRVGEAELRVIKEPEDKTQAEERLRQLQIHTDNLLRKEAFLKSMLHSLLRRLAEGGAGAVPDPDSDLETKEYPEAAEGYEDLSDEEAKGLDTAPLADYVSDFNNRFIVHNAQVKWNNSLRNIILRYIHQVGQRRGFVYYMSRRAVKFILDIVEEQNKSKERQNTKSVDELSVNGGPLSPDEVDELSIRDRVEQLLNDGKKLVDANDPDTSQDGEQSGEKEEEVSREYTAQNTYHVRLLAPQIQLQSEKNPNSAVLVTTKSMQLKVVQIMDKDRVMDDVSGLVQRRFAATMDSLQIFVTSKKTFSNEYLHMYSGNSYGAPSGTLWPPWVPLEIMYEFDNNPYGFKRVVQRTSATMRYDKYNTLRLKYNDNVSGDDNSRIRSSDYAENRIDRIWVDFPEVKAICDSSQYYALYLIVLDLLLYNEPLEKTRSERLEKIMLASDFSDLTGAPEMVEMLQQRIRQLEEIKLHFQVNEKYLDRQGWKDRISMEQDLAICEDELFFMMKAITTSQRKNDERGQATQSKGLLRWYIRASEIVWHLVRVAKGTKESLAEFQLRNALFDRTDNTDGSNINCVEIEGIMGYNLIPNAIYPQMIAPFIENNKPFSEGREVKMLRVQWYMLEAIAGIPVMDHFEVNLFPLKVQLEHDIAKKLFEYIFPGSGSGASVNGNFSPFMVKHILPSQEDEGENGNDNSEYVSLSSDIPHDSDTQASDGDANSVELRLHPTLSLPDNKRPKSAHSTQSFKHHAYKDLSHLRLFKDTPSQRPSSSASASIFRGFGGDRSGDTLLPSLRPPSRRSTANLTASSAASINTEAERAKHRFKLHRSGTAKTSSSSKKQRSDDLTQMMTRASNYMTLAYVKIPSVVLCLSYKGKGQRNFEDVHNLVFRMPTLEYRNKTWSNLDLALQLKKDVIRALISHTGAIIGNKFAHHRPNIKQTSRLREIANSSTMLSSQSPDWSSSNPHSESESYMGDSPVEGRSEASSLMEPRKSFASGRSVSGRSGRSGLSYESSSMFSGLNPGAAKSISGSSRKARSEYAVDEGGDADDVSGPASSGSTFHELRSRRRSEPDRETLGSSLSRHLTAISHRQRPKTSDGAADDDNESIRRKSRLLLGKLIPH